jgi:hypothetical protein
MYNLYTKDMYRICVGSIIRAMNEIMCISTSLSVLRPQLFIFIVKILQIDNETVTNIWGHSPFWKSLRSSYVPEI